jgi:hypothetical protein
MTNALKFLRPGRIGPFTGVEWPEAGGWLASNDEPRLCRSGIHALKASSLPVWMTEELWRVELEDAHEVDGGIIVARRGRLVDRVGAWNDDLAREYGEVCVAHVPADGPPLTRERRADAVAVLGNVRAGMTAAAIGYITAKAVEALAPGGYEAERRWQAEWLSDRLGLAL